MKTHRRSGGGAGACAAALALLAAGTAIAAPPPPPNPLMSLRGASVQRCNVNGGPVCSVVSVPVDRSGRVPGTIGLHVEVLAPKGVSRGAIFLVAGGPGQGSARSFDLSSKDMADFYRYLFPGYTLVAYDDRGTGASGFLDCASFRSAGDSTDITQVTAACAQELGPQRDFYSTADHAEDLDAVRQALGLDRIAIWGVSYGTKLALAYARAHPDHVERLVLDSVVGPARDEAFGTDVLQAMPDTLTQFCADGACADATPGFADDVAGVENQLHWAPRTARVRQPDGTFVDVTLDSAGFLGLVVGADLDPGLAAALPAAVHAARTDNPWPLFRLYVLASSGGSEPSSSMSGALHFATVCADGPFPWLPGTPLDERARLVDHTLATLPAGSFGPFGSWATSLGEAGLCLGWPGTQDATPAASGPLPDVPVLAVNGGLDLRTPVAGAAAVAAEFPRGHLLVVPGVGHSVLTTDPSLCSERAVRAWMLHDTAPTSCARVKPYLQPLGAFPDPPPGRLAPAQTLGVAAKTVEDAEAVWLMIATPHEKLTVPGLYGGKLVATDMLLVLNRYSIAPGLTISGTLAALSFGPPLEFVGSVRVGGTVAAQGRLGLLHARLDGTLGGRKVSVSLVRH